MGHAFDYRVYDEKTSFEEMHRGSCEFAYCNVDRQENPAGSYGNTWLKHRRILDSYEDAEKYLYEQGTYVDGCVRFKEPGIPSKKMNRLEKRISTLLHNKRAYDKAHSITDRKAAFIGCRSCKSKLTRGYLKSNKCPVCGADLRAEYILEKLDEYDSKVKSLMEELKMETAKQAEKRPKIKWLVKTEVHC